MANFECVPVVVVTRENIQDIWPCILFCVRSSSFVAIDLELSGLGNRRELNAKSVEDRYRAMVQIATTRSIISLGLSFFLENPSLTSESDKCSKRYQVQTFNLMCLCSEEYTVEPESLQFLVNHGFDFNRQCSSGLLYYRGSDKQLKTDNYLRELFVELLKGKRPLVLHNGFVDLVFLYGNLYCTLPTTLAAFLTDMQQMFPQGIYDTKYLAEYRQRLTASYLEYVFKKSQHSNWNSCTAGRSCVKLAFMSYPPNFPVEFCYTKLRQTPKEVGTPVCKFYASHGWCSKGELCQESHNVDDIIDEEISRQRKKKKKRGDSTYVPEVCMSEDSTPAAPHENGTSVAAVSVNGNPNTGCHRAGYDAFMTGFIFASHLVTVKNADDELQELKNKLYLCRKDVPLLIVSSNFSKPSPAHTEKFDKIFS